MSGYRFAIYNRYGVGFDIQVDTPLQLKAAVTSFARSVACVDGEGVDEYITEVTALIATKMAEEVRSQQG